MPLIEGINITTGISRKDADEENESQYGSDIDDGSKIDKEDNYFHPHNNYASDEKDNNKECVFVENWEWGPVTDYIEIHVILDHYDGTHGLKSGVEKNKYTILE